jgi:hypothetical protein
VVPGCYAGEAIRIHDEPTAPQVAYQEQWVRADELAGKIVPRLLMQPAASYLLLELLGELWPR